MLADYTASEPTGRYCGVGQKSAFSRPAARYVSKTGDDDVTRFRRLVRQWRAATVFSSSVSEAIHDKNFRSIVEMGPKVVPLIVEEISTQPDLLVAALPILTGEDPVHDNDRGNLPAMAGAWMEWASEQSWR